jgi:spoIIIJ-associated protein
MNEYEDLHEFTGATAEEAIANGLNALGINREEAIIVVIEEGSKGLFGLGSKDAVVHVRPADPAKYAATMERPIPAEEEFKDEALEDEDEDFSDDDFSDEDFSDEDIDGADDDGFKQEDDSAARVWTGEEEDLMQITRATVEELLEKMHVRADVSAKIMPPDDHSGRSAVVVDITGDDLSILIGRKAETLDALEYITRLIVGKEVSSSVLINLDVQGYRKRKEQRLRRIARTVARQAIDTGQRQYLEPMSPAERRIIHIELRDHPEVYTESIGDGHRRKVTINLRES